MELMSALVKYIRVPDWNVKRKSTLEYHRIKQGIQKYGQLEPIHVRQIEGLYLYEIVNGRTVFSAIKDLGIEKVYCVNHGPISQQRAEEIYLQLEFSGTQIDPLKLSGLVHAMSKKEDITALQNRLPFDKEQIQYFVELHEFDWRAHLSKPKDEKQASLF